MSKVREGKIEMNDLTGMKIGRLKVLGLAYIKDRHAYWRCQCSCGCKTVIRGAGRRGRSPRNCTCKDRIKSLGNKSHGESGNNATPEYISWKSMVARCSRKSHPHFKYWGGRGIKVCRRWIKYENFIRDMGRKPSPSHTIDRIDNNKSYSPKNCRWATHLEQSENRRNNHWITLNGDKKTITAWAKETGIDFRTLYHRVVYRRWPIEKALKRIGR